MKSSDSPLQVAGRLALLRKIFWLFTPSSSWTEDVSSLPSFAEKHHSTGPSHSRLAARWCCCSKKKKEKKKSFSLAVQIDEMQKVVALDEIIH